jgi:hypothetical protein
MTEKIVVLLICTVASIPGFWLIGYGIWCMISDSRKK